MCYKEEEIRLVSIFRSLAMKYLLILRDKKAEPQESTDSLLSNSENVFLCNTHIYGWPLENRARAEAIECTHSLTLSESIFQALISGCFCVYELE